MKTNNNFFIISVDEKLQSVLASREDQSEIKYSTIGFYVIKYFFSELDLQNRRLQRELRLKETTIDELKERIENLERKLEACGESGTFLKYIDKQSHHNSKYLFARLYRLKNCDMY